MKNTCEKIVELSRMQIEGKTFVDECVITTVTDIRQTIIGPWNFGYTRIGQTRTREITPKVTE